MDQAWKAHHGWKESGGRPQSQLLLPQGTPPGCSCQALSPPGQRGRRGQRPGGRCGRRRLPPLSPAGSSSSLPGWACQGWPRWPELPCRRTKQQQAEASRSFQGRQPSPPLPSPDKTHRGQEGQLLLQHPPQGPHSPQAQKEREGRRAVAAPLRAKAAPIPFTHNQQGQPKPPPSLPQHAASHTPAKLQGKVLPNAVEELLPGVQLHVEVGFSGLHYLKGERTTWGFLAVLPTQGSAWEQRGWGLSRELLGHLWNMLSLGSGATLPPRTRSSRAEGELRALLISPPHRFTETTPPSRTEAQSGSHHLDLFCPHSNRNRQDRLREGAGDQES